MADNAPPCFFERAQARAVGNQRLYFRGKRCMDIVAILCWLSLCGSPCSAAYALLIKLDSPGPVVGSNRKGSGCEIARPRC